MNERISSGLGLPAPLRVVPDMIPNWEEVDMDFDTAAARFVERHDADGASRDLPVMDLRTWGVAPEGEHFSLKPLAGHEPPRKLRANALSMLCARLGAPTEFVRDKLPAPLQTAILNVLLAQGERAGTAVLRLRGNEIGAVVTDRYTALDAPELMNTLRAALSRHGLLDTVRVHALATGVTDVIRLVLPSEAEPVQVGDVSLVGIDVSSSSFGRSALHIKGSLVRLICRNGMRAPTAMGGQISLRHLGETQRLRDGVAEGVATALVHARGLMKLWKSAVVSHISDLSAFINDLRELDQSEQASMRSELGASKPSELPKRASVFDVVNALTHSAQAAGPYRRIELEEIAGRILVEHVEPS
jgi:hypothetical protein